MKDLTSQNFNSDSKQMDSMSSIEIAKKILGFEVFSSFSKEIFEKLSEPVVIAFMGKTGAGLSSACNALFEQDLFEIDDVEVCTHQLQYNSIEFKSCGLTLVDIPGVGEILQDEEAYRKLYADVLVNGVLDTDSNRRRIDAIVWLIKSDDRSLELDQYFFEDILKLYFGGSLDRLVLAISQADCIEPIRGDGSWNIPENKPGDTQIKNLDKKALELSRIFGISKDRIAYFSALENYNLDSLIEKIMCALPHGKALLIANWINSKKPYNVTKNIHHLAGKSLSKLFEGVLLEKISEDWINWMNTLGLDGIEED